MKKGEIKNLEKQKSENKWCTSLNTELYFELKKKNTGKVLLYINLILAPPPAQKKYNSY